MDPLREQLANGLSRARDHGVQAESRNLFGLPAICGTPDSAADALNSNWESNGGMSASSHWHMSMRTTPNFFGSNQPESSSPKVLMPYLKAAGTPQAPALVLPRRRRAFLPPEHLGLEGTFFGTSHQETGIKGGDRKKDEVTVPINPFLEERDEARERSEMRRQAVQSEKYLKRKLGDLKRLRVHKELFVASQSGDRLYENALFYSDTAHAKHMRLIRAQQHPHVRRHNHTGHNSVPGLVRCAPPLMTSPRLHGANHKLDEELEQLRAIEQKASGSTAEHKVHVSKTAASGLPPVTQEISVPIKEHLKTIATLRKKLTSSSKKMRQHLPSDEEAAEPKVKKKELRASTITVLGGKK